MGGNQVLKHLKSSEEFSEKSLGAKGFTLIELLVVVVILGILAAVVVFSVSGFTEDAQDNACDTEERTLATAVETYYALHRGWPADATTLQTAGLIRDASNMNHTVNSDGTIVPTPAGEC